MRLSKHPVSCIQYCIKCNTKCGIHVYHNRPLENTLIKRSVSYINWNSNYLVEELFLHWGRVTHICVSRITNIGSDNGLSPGRRQTIIWTNAGIVLIGLFGTNFSKILIEIHIFSFKKMHFKWSSGKWRPFCSGLNVLKVTDTASMDSVDVYFYMLSMSDKWCYTSWSARQSTNLYPFSKF